MTGGEDWFVRRDGSMFPVSYTAVADRDRERDGSGDRVHGHRGAPPRRAGAARARGDPREGRPAGLGRRPRGPVPLRQPGGAARARLRGPLRAQGQARAQDGALQVPRRDAVPGGGLPDHARPADRGAALRSRGLARAQGRLDPADRVLDGAVRPARRPRLGDRVHRRRGAPAAEQAARERDVAAPGRPSCAARAGASSRPRTPPARGSSATCTTAPSSSSSTSRCGCGSRAASCPPTRRRRRGCSTTRSSWRPPRRELRELAAGIHPAILTHRGLGPAVARLRRGCRCPSPARDA